MSARMKWPSLTLAITLAAGWTCVSPGAEVQSQDPAAKRAENENTTIAKGTVVSTVVGKGRQWLQVRSVSGKTEKYLEHWEGGKKVSEGLEGVEVGDRVVLNWAVNDHPRVMSVRELRR